MIVSLVCLSRNPNWGVNLSWCLRHAQPAIRYHQRYRRLHQVAVAFDLHDVCHRNDDCLLGLFVTESQLGSQFVLVVVHFGDRHHEGRIRPPYLPAMSAPCLRHAQPAIRYHQRYRRLHQETSRQTLESICGGSDGILGADATIRFAAVETCIVVYKRIAETWKDKTIPPEVVDRLANLTRTAEYLTNLTVLLQGEDIGTCTLEFQENDMLDLDITASQCVMNRIAETWKDKTIPPEVVDRLANLTRTAEYLTNFPNGFT
jgi:hypothetical protein